ncbi:MAG: serine hydrolase, partial [Bdellovibrionia bacterium]
MKKQMTFLLAILLLQSIAVASDWSDQIKGKVDGHMKAHFANQAQVGVIVGAVKGTEQHVWSWGEKVRGSGRMVNSDTFFEIGSITKTFVATLLALELGRGRVDLNDPVSRYWPDLKGTDAGKITLVELATHHSGLPRMPSGFTSAYPENPFKDYDSGKLLSFLKAFKQQKAGPYDYVYSNLGLGLLGFLLSEKLNGMTFTKYLDKYLLSPLGLYDIKVAVKEADLSRTAYGYSGFFDVTPFLELGSIEGAGVLRATGADLMRYVMYQMKPDNSELGKAMKLAQTPRADTDRPGTKIGLVWESEKMGSYNVTDHGGATLGYRALAIFDREKQIGGIIMSNTENYPRCLIGPLVEIECAVPAWAKLSESHVKKLAGVYSSKVLGIEGAIVSVNGFPGIQIVGQPKIRLWAVNEMELHVPELGVKIAFNPPEGGAYAGFNLTQGGKTFYF